MAVSVYAIQGDVSICTGIGWFIRIGPRWPEIFPRIDWDIEMSNWDRTSGRFALHWQKKRCPIRCSSSNDNLCGFANKAQVKWLGRRRQTVSCIVLKTWNSWEYLEYYKSVVTNANANHCWIRNTHLLFIISPEWNVTTWVCQMVWIPTGKEFSWCYDQETVGDAERNVV